MDNKRMMYRIKEEEGKHNHGKEMADTLKSLGQLEISQLQYITRHKNDRQDHKLCFVDKVWIYLCNKFLRVMKNFKPVRHEPFHIIKHVNENAFKLIFHPYMRISSMVNVKYLKSFYPFMLNIKEE
jgi:hypothetical protein